MPPRTSDGQATYFFASNRNKKSLTLNLKHQRGKEVLRALVARSDVLVENFTPGTMEKLGLGYESLRAVHPRLIYCGISGFGATGPYREHAGYDAIHQGITGLMSITGEPDGPPTKVGVALLDEISALYAHGAILAAIHARQRTGVGQKIDLSLLEAGVASLLNSATAYLIAGEVQKREGTAHPSLAPYQAFRAKDDYLMVGAGNDRLWNAFCDAIGAPEWTHDPRFDSNAKRVTNRKELVQLIEERLQARARDEWVGIFAAAGIAVGPINSIDQVFAHPQVIHRQTIQEIHHPTAGRVRLVGVPVKFSENPGSVRTPPPLLGEHTNEVLSGILGYSDAEISQFKADGVI